jgi:thiamine biosynthesis lipoprotein
MSAASNTPIVERSRPLLGTFVNIKIAGLPDADAHRVIEDGFAVVAKVQALMSFHEPESEVSLLNRRAAREAVPVAPETFHVVECACAISEASEGVFDITVAPQLVEWGFLPRPAGAPDPDPAASWRDIELIAPHSIRFRRPLWIDVGGIAKGFAVDHAVVKMNGNAAIQCCVNAGGDLRVSGAQSERVLLRTDRSDATVPVVELENGSLASSSGREQRRRHGDSEVGPHIHGRSRASVGTNSFVSVIAPECIIADALTKVVLTLGADAAPLLARYGATAYLQDAQGEWRIVGREGL